MLDTVAGGTEVIQQNDVWNTQLFDKAGGVDDPRKIRSSHAAVDHWPGDAEAGCNDPFLAQMIGGLVREFLNDALKSGELLAGEALLENRREGTAFFGEERQITLRAANVLCKDHLFPVRVVNRFKARCARLCVVALPAVRLHWNVGLRGPLASGW